MTLLLLFSFMLAGNAVGNSQDQDKEAIKNTMVEYYWNVMYTNDERKPVSAIAEGFHEDFHMYVYYEGKLSVRTRDQWMEILQRNRDKQQTDLSPKPRPVNSLEFGLIDIAGQTAVVKLLISSNGKLKYTDYFTLYKIDGEWKVMTKLFSFHLE